MLLPPGTPGTCDGEMPCHLDPRQFPWPDKQLFVISKISGPDFFFWTAVQGAGKV